MKDHPTISVIIPLYNKEAIIRRSVGSVLGQSFTDFELIIVNDGSTDNSMDVVRSIKDSRITVIEQKNGGPGAARNTGIRAAKGDWVLLLDADDELLQDALLTGLNSASHHPECNLLDFNEYRQQGGQRSIRERTHEGVVNNNFRAWYFRQISPGSDSTLFKRSLLKEFPYNESLTRYEDAEILFRLLRKAKVYCSSLPVAVVNNDFCEASHPSNDIRKDFIGHLYFKDLSFWELMCMYKLYIEERENYPKDAKTLYPSIRYRYDLLFIYKLLPHIQQLIPSL